ncbi:MAG: hypothetical protein J1D77_05195 [Muribaculaceae bacterium]|nr:hypothetical protein [Muribaculaceae bacterium]
MTQIIVTLEPGADSGFLQRAIDNMKGVFKTSLMVNSADKVSESDTNEWLERLHQLKKDINPEVIDMTDERTRYLMSK